MIYVVGDLHGDLSKIKKLHEDKKLSKSDTVILLGDTGLSSTYEMFATSLKTACGYPNKFSLRPRRI